MPVLHKEYKNLPASARGAVVAIGNFDGVHLGHQALITAALRLARQDNAPLAVMTFEPHPRAYFAPDSLPFRLTLLPEKFRLLGLLGVEHVYALAFDAALASLSAERFVQEVLREGLGARHVVVGADFAFGKGRGGTIATLEAVVRTGVFGLTVHPLAGAGEAVYSSTRIREKLAQGDVDGAAQMLGRMWEMEGVIVHGDKRGRTLGFPTANQRMEQYQRLPFGIYAVEVCIEGETRVRGGVANFGIRPMFRINEPILETFIFDFAQDIYGKNMRVRPLRRLRAEQAFEDISGLLAQMKQDCLDARAVLKFNEETKVKAQ